MPEIQIQELLEAINRDGIEKGEAEAKRIMADAAAKADLIIREAEEKSKAMISAAKAECDVFVKQGQAALGQAARNVCLSLKSELNGMLGNVIRKSLAPALHSDSIVGLVREAMKSVPSQNVVLELSKDAYEVCANALHDEISKGLEVRIGTAVRTGFRLSEKDGSGYYDFSEDELIGLIMPYLSDSLNDALKG